MVHQHGDHHDIPKDMIVQKPGAWLPADHRVHREYLQRVTKHVDSHEKKPELSPALKEFKAFIEGDARLRMLFTSMFEEIPKKHPYWKDPTGAKAIRDYPHMLDVLNHITTRAPEWTDAAHSVGVVGVPMCALFDWPMGTSSGHAVFLDPGVNRMLKKVLNEWGKFLLTPESAEVLGDDVNGWFGKTGLTDVMEVANAPLKTNMAFEDMFVCDPKAKFYGYKSWDDFFTRQVKDEARPIASPDDNSVINNACESKTYHIEHHVRLHDHFWAKGQPYSILDMLAQDHENAKHFTGGTVYQAFLSALSYHRWHSPVSGTIKRAHVVDGTYFSEPLFEGIGDSHTKEIDSRGISLAQGYLTSLACRGIVLIEADNPDIGLMGCVFIGMDEVSTNDITVKEGQHVKKGEQLGMFHFGGSSHCLLFRKGVKLHGLPQPGQDHNVPVRSKLCTVSKE